MCYALGQALMRRTRRLDHEFFFFQAEDGIRDYKVTGVQTCALPICRSSGPPPLFQDWAIRPPRIGAASRASAAGVASGGARILWGIGAPAWRGHANNAANKRQPGCRISGSRDCRDAYRGNRASHIIRSLPGTKVRRRRVPARWRVRMILDVVEIQKILPHRYPFLMVDGILEVERLKRIVGVKNVTINEAHF